MQKKIIWNWNICEFSCINFILIIIYWEEKLAQRTYSLQDDDSFDMNKRQNIILERICIFVQ